jgi:hypothetical protein
MKTPKLVGPACLVLLAAACGGEVSLGGQLPAPPITAMSETSDSAGAAGLYNSGQMLRLAAGSGGQPSCPALDAGGAAAAPGTGLDACPQTNQQASNLLNSRCSQCHSSADGWGLPYLSPGDPDHSLVYLRAVTMCDMPPSIAGEPPEILSASEGALLRDWITNCLN